jgi:hypothetical protein
LKPGRPVELPVADLLVTIGVGETIDVPRCAWLSSGAYVKDGMLGELRDWLAITA